MRVKLWLVVMMTTVALGCGPAEGPDDPEAVSYTHLTLPTIHSV